MRGILWEGSRDRPQSWLTPGPQSLARLTSGHRLPAGGSETNPSLTDVDRGVPISVVLVTAAGAEKYCPLRAAGGVDDPAHRAGDARVRRRDLDQDRPVPRALVSELAADQAPTLVEDGSVEAGLGGHVAPRLLDRASCRARHIRYHQRLNRHQAVVLGQMCRELVGKVVPPVAGPPMQGGGLPGRAQVAIRARLLGLSASL